MKPKVLLIAVIIVMIAMLHAYAQIPMGPVKANIPFQFIAAGKTLPAGDYTFFSDDESIRVVGPGRGDDVLVGILTRVSGAMHTTPSDCHIVFDNVAGLYTLSEIWITGTDAYIVNATKAKHEHRTVSVPR